MKGNWLSAIDWSVVIATNRALCLPSNALHRPTSDGYEATKTLWESTHQQAMTIAEATELCRRCHRLAPFCNFNGNTFVTIIRKVIGSLPLAPDQATILRSLAGHIVAGIATPEEGKAFQAVLSRLSGSHAFRHCASNSASSSSNSSAVSTCPRRPTPAVRRVFMSLEKRNGIPADVPPQLRS